MAQPRTQLFISYSHHDREWLERLRVHLLPRVRNSTIDLWDDTRIQPDGGQLARRRIPSARAALHPLSERVVLNEDSRRVTRGSGRGPRPEMYYCGQQHGLTDELGAGDVAGDMRV